MNLKLIVYRFLMKYSCGIKETVTVTVKKNGDILVMFHSVKMMCGHFRLPFNHLKAAVLSPFHFAPTAARHCQQCTDTEIKTTV